MPWCWELAEWPEFTYDPGKNAAQEKQFLLNAGIFMAFLRNAEKSEYRHLVVEVLSTEGIESSRIEGELLDRESLQSSIQRHFDLKPGKKEKEHESKVAHLLLDVYENFDEPLSHECLWKWHALLFSTSQDIEDKGAYRTHSEPMQIVSQRFGSYRVFYEAPPSKRMKKEMSAFIKWFNMSKSMPVLERAAVAHLYFEMIHPFEDGNGRIGRLLVEKVLSQGVGRSVLIAVSKILETRRKEYYAALEACNRSLNIDGWVAFFADVILQAQAEATQLIEFLLAKTNILSEFRGKLNERQEKVLLRMFEEGPSGFKGGLSAENYISIAKTSRATATRDLSELVELGVFVKTGELRHTRYRIQNHKNS